MTDFERDLTVFGYDESGEWHPRPLPTFKSFLIALPVVSVLWIAGFWVMAKLLQDYQ
jgi:hypothetical protein